MKARKLIGLLFGVALLAGCSELHDDLSPVVANKCRACHGFPPANAVHIAHVDSMGYACDLCHPGVNDTLLTVAQGHGDGVLKVDIATAFDSAGLFFYDQAKQTCNLTYCHGAVVPGDSGIISVADSVTGCGSCHNLSKLALVDHHDKIQTPVLNKCYLCHPGDTLATQSTNAATHLNGKTDIGGCDLCHESRTWTRD